MVILARAIILADHMKRKVRLNIFVFLAPVLFCGAFFCLAFFVATIAIPSAQALTVPETPPPQWKEGNYGATLNSEFFSSSGNYEDQRNSFAKLADTGTSKITAFENRIKGRYAPSDLSSWYLGVGYAQIRTTTATLETTNAGLNEVFLGVDFLSVRRWMNVVPELEFSYPVNATDTKQTTPLLSDGVSYARAGLFLFKRYPRFRVESYLGSHIPFEPLAKRFVYSLVAEVALFSSFTFGGGVDGYETVIADTNSYAQRKTLTDRVMAGSQRYWAKDPALLEGKIWLGLRPDRAFTIRLGYAKTINGLRTAEGNSILLNVTFNAPGAGGVVDESAPTAKTPQGPVSAQGEKWSPDPAKAPLDDTEKMLEREKAE